MKKILLSLTMLATLAVANARPVPDVSEKIKKSFQQEFSGAKVLEWNDAGEFVKATFLIGGLRAEAYFSPNGELQGSVRTLFYNQLPLAVIASVDRRCGESTPVLVTEVTNGDGTSYHLNMEGNEKKFRLVVDANGNITDIEKTKVKKG
jgi:hypothetical protein